MTAVDTIAVTGAGGWIGREVCTWLEHRGARVRRMSRSLEDAGGTFLDLTAAPGDPAWLAAVRGCRTVLHCAAHVPGPGTTSAQGELFRTINVDGTRQLLEACRAADVRRVVFVSTSALYDYSPSRAVSEAGAQQPRTAYAASKADAEHLVRDSGLDWRIARLGTVFGVGDRANFHQLARAMKQRRFVIPGRGDARKSVLLVDRAAELLGRLALDDDKEAVTVNFAAPSAPSLAEICDAFTRHCGFPKPVPVPMPIMRCAARAGDVLRRAGVHAPLTTEVLEKLTTTTVLDVSRMLTLFPGMDWPDFEATLAGAARYYAEA